MDDAERRAVDYIPPGRTGGAVCPKCAAVCVKVEQTVVRTRTAVVRWHRCACGLRFKSVEKVPAP